MPEKNVLTLPGFSLCLIILDIWQSFEHISDIKYAMVFNIQHFSYNNIIIVVTNVIILELLSARFVHPGYLQLNILSFFNTSYNIGVTKLLINFFFWLQWRKSFRKDLKEHLRVLKLDVLNVKKQKWS